MREPFMRITSLYRGIIIIATHNPTVGCAVSMVMLLALLIKMVERLLAVMNSYTVHFMVRDRSERRRRGQKRPHWTPAERDGVAGAFVPTGFFVPTGSFVPCPPSPSPLPATEIMCKAQSGEFKCLCG